MGYMQDWLGDDVSGWQLVVVDPIRCWMDGGGWILSGSSTLNEWLWMWLCSRRPRQDVAVRCNKSEGVVHILLAMLSTLHGKNLKSQMKYQPSLAQLKCSITPRLSFCKVLLVVKRDRWKETFKSSSAAFRLIKRVCCERSQTVSSVLYFQDAQSANEWTGRTYSTQTHTHTPPC